MKTRAVALTVTTAITVGALAGAAVAATPSSRPPAGLQTAADKLVADGQPGVIMMTRRGDQVAHITAGLADRATAEPMRADDRFHIGSITKSFVAVVVLQLAAEHRLNLQDPVDKWLPGLLGDYGKTITIRQLLQQTSGLPDYVQDPQFQTPAGLGKVWQPEQLVAIALQQGPLHEGWYYSNTNYIVAGLIIEKVTGHSAGAEIDRRILDPLKLRDTSFPLTSTKIPGPHAHGYFGPLGDVTTMVNPSVAWTAGAMISTVDDIATFYRALMSGQLLSEQEQRELLNAIPVNDNGLFDESYGLGIYRVQLSCGTAWGHDGGYPGGFKSFAYTSPDGSRQATIVYNDFGISDGPDNPVFRQDLQRATETAFCATTSPSGVITDRRR